MTGKTTNVREAMSRETELGIIGWVISQPSQAHVVEQCQPGDFADAKRGAAFAAAMALANETGDVAPSTLRKKLVESEVCTFEAAVGWIRDCGELAPVQASAAAQLVAELRHEALARRLVVVGTTIAEAGKDPDAPQSHDGLLDHVEQMFHDSLKHEQALRAWTVGELLDEDMRLLTTSKPGVITGLPFGFAELDAMTSGAQPGDMIVVAARPSMGKSALAGQFSANWSMGSLDALESGVPAEQMELLPGVLFTLEMSGTSYIQRILCSRSDVNLQNRRRNHMRDGEYSRYMAQHKALKRSPMRIIDRSTVRLSEFRSMCRRLRDEVGIKYVVVDYLQLMHGTRRKGDSREQEVSSISAGLKAVARELSVPVIAVAQLNRSNEQRSDRRPQMSDLRESGSLEQDADVIMLLHREEYYHVNDPGWKTENPDKVGLAELIIAKQRNGPVGTIQLRWDASYAKFFENAQAGPSVFQH